MPGLVGVREVARVPGWRADWGHVGPGEQEAALGRLLGLQLCWDWSLCISLHQTLDVPRVPASY